MRAPIVIAIICQPSAIPGIMHHEEIASVAIAVQNMHLGARALGLAGFWSSGQKIKHPSVRALLELNESAECLGFFYLGLPSLDWPSSKRGNVEDKVRWAT